MLNKLTIAFVAGALAFASFPAFAADIPDYGSKNFNPTGDTPSYFANESAPVSARTADTTATDWTAEEAAAPTPSVTSPVSSAHRATGRHAKYAAAQRSGKHIPGKAMAHSTRSAKAGTATTAKTDLLHNSAASKRPAWAASSKGAAKAGAVSGAKTTTAKHGKASARHAGSFIIDPAGLPTEA